MLEPFDVVDDSRIDSVKAVTQPLDFGMPFIAERARERRMAFRRVERPRVPKQIALYNLFDRLLALRNDDMRLGYASPADLNRRRIGA